MTKQLKSGATVPAQNRAAVLGSLNEVAGAQDVDPAAIAGMINTESAWKTTCITGQYVGLTQVSAEFVQSLKMTRAQFVALSADAQIDAYGKWLDQYAFSMQMAKYAIDVSSLPVARQAAVLQGMQFAPYGDAWKTALANGNYAVRTTTSKQASFLGDTSIGAMERYYGDFFRKYPPVYL